MRQWRLPGTLPTPEMARKAHKKAVATERAAQAIVDNLRASMREARETLKKAQEQRRTAEDDLDAIEEGRRPER